MSTPMEGRFISQRSIDRYLPWIVLGIYWPALFISTHIPKLPAFRIYGHDMTLHFSAYLLLMLFFWLARHGKVRPHLRDFRSRLTILIPICYGGVDEITQEVVGRKADVFDWFSDVGGIVTALLMLYFFRRSVYWLVIYFAGLFLLTHWPVRGSAFLQLPLFWRQFQAAYMMTGYIGLTLLFWRSFCGGGRFVYHRKILVLTLLAVPFYAFLDEMINVWIGRGFDTTDFLSGLGGVVLGVAGSMLLAKHHTSREEKRW